MPSISERVRSISPSPIRKLSPHADRREEQGVKVHHLNIGQPDVKTPLGYMEGARQAPIDVLAYSPSRGIASLRKSLLEYYRSKSIELSEGELVVTTGGSEGLLFTLLTVLDSGEELIVPEPFYANYAGIAGMVGGKIRPVTRSAADGFRLPSAGQIEREIGPDCAAFLITNPDNPSGVAYGEEELEILARLARQYDLFLIADEVYRDFFYGDGSLRGVLGLDGMEERAIMVDSISKRFSACGARIGTLASRNTQVMEAVTRLAQARLSPPTLEQFGLINLLQNTNYEEFVDRTVRNYENRRDVLLEELKKIPGALFRKPEGAFYVLVKLPLESAEDFAKWLLTDFEEGGETVMVAPASGFYASSGLGEDEIRLSYVLEEGRLRRAVSLLRKGLTAYLEQEEIGVERAGNNSRSPISIGKEKIDKNE